MANLLLVLSAIACSLLYLTHATSNLGFSNHFNTKHENPNKLIDLDTNLRSNPVFSKEATQRNIPITQLTHRFGDTFMKSHNLRGTHMKFHSLLISHDVKRVASFGMSQSLRREMLDGNSSFTSNFALQGSVYPSGLYRATIGLGTPEQIFNVAIDTGSSITWVNCIPCDACATSLVQQLNPPFDSGKSSTARPIVCDSATCRSLKQFGTCSGEDSTSPCGYHSGYADGSSTTGTLLKDIFWLAVGRGSQRPTTFPFVFGCGNSQTGTFLRGYGWTVYDAVDGLMGLGRAATSVSAQLALNSTQLQVKNIFTICLGTGFSGGLLAFGDEHVPKNRIVYTPIIKDSPYFLVGLLNVEISGIPLSVPRAVYGDVRAGNAIFDSGTSYTYVPTKLQNAIMNMLKLRVPLTPAVDNPPNGTFQGFLCYDESDEFPVSRIASKLPNINLQFLGRGKFLNLPPEAYTFVVEDEKPRQLCTRIVPLDSAFMIIGDIWMRNYVFIHDLDKLRLGWSPMQCI